MVKKRFPFAAELEYPAGTPSCVVCKEQVNEWQLQKYAKRPARRAAESFNRYRWRGKTGPRLAATISSPTADQIIVVGMVSIGM